VVVVDSDAGSALAAASGLQVRRLFPLEEEEEEEEGHGKGAQKREAKPADHEAVVAALEALPAGTLARALDDRARSVGGGGGGGGSNLLCAAAAAGCLPLVDAILDCVDGAGRGVNVNDGGAKGGPTPLLSAVRNCARHPPGPQSYGAFAYVGYQVRVFLILASF
jgi:hypothetical protein